MDTSEAGWRTSCRASLTEEELMQTKQSRWKTTQAIEEAQSMALLGNPIPCLCLCGAPKPHARVPRLPPLSFSSKPAEVSDARRLHHVNVTGWPQTAMAYKSNASTHTHCRCVPAGGGRGAAAGHEEEEDRKAAALLSSEDVKRTILWSDVVLRPQRRESVRQWNMMDVTTAGVVVLMHVLCLAAPFTFRWGALWTAVGLYVATGLLGITLSFHRNLAHHSFRLPKWLEYTFAYCGVQALQGNPVDWVSTHRYHHQYCDSLRDPHSPKDGFWFSHVTWLFDTAAVIQRCGSTDNVGDLKSQPFYRFLRRTYVAHPMALALLLYTVGGLPYLVWGMGVRIVWVYHITWLVNSACHVWGHQSWNTGDLSRNNWWVALLAFGEGWHNNHHAFEYSARHGLEWWQVDATWYVVQLLQELGLATHVRLPLLAHMRAMSRAAAGPASAL